MLQRMRDMQGWVAWLIIILVSLSLLSFNFYAHSPVKQANNITAQVNDVVITHQQVAVISHQLRQKVGPLVDEPALENNVIQELIDQALLTEISQKNGFNISENLIGASIGNIPEFQQNGQFSQTRFSAVVNQLGYTPAQFVETIRDELLSDQLVKGINNSAFTLRDETRAAIGILKQTRDFSYATLSFADYVVSSHISREQAQQFYKINLAKFSTPEAIRVDYLVLLDKAIIEKLQPSEIQLRQFYQDKISNYTQAKQWKIAHIFIANNDNKPLMTSALAKIQTALNEKKDFTAVAQQFSDDPVSANKGGILPWLTIDSLPPYVQKVVINLNIGDISVPIQTARGYEIIKVLAIKPAEVIPFSQVAGQLKTAYIQQQAQQQFSAVTQRLQDLVFQNPTSLIPAAKSLNITVQTSDWLQPHRSAPGVFANKDILQTVFSDQIRNGNNSEVLYPDLHTALVMRINEYQAAKTIPFAQLEGKIKTLLASQASQRQVQLVADKVTNELNAGHSLAYITHSYGLHWQAAKNIQRQAEYPQINPLILRTAFNVPPPQDHKIISAANVMLPGKVIVIVGVSAVHDHPATTLLPAEELVYQLQLRNYFSECSLFELTNYWRRQAKIKIYTPSR